MPLALLEDRAVLSVAGLDARKFLQGLVTCDVDALRPGEAAFGALLSPQGKILFDFFVVCTTGLSCPPALSAERASSEPGSELDSRAPLRDVGNNRDESFLLDAPKDLAPSLAKRLSMYRLRAKVAVELTSFSVAAIWGGSLASLPNIQAPHPEERRSRVSKDGPTHASFETPAEFILAPAEGRTRGQAPQDEGRGIGDLSPDCQTVIKFVDPRAKAMGWRIIVDTTNIARDMAAYDAHRIALGIPKGGVDFAWGEAFPHEANMDLVHGVSFTKGCYVGQEIVSRMEHRGTARRRIVTARFDGDAPPAGADIVAGDLALGTMGSSSGSNGLASVRLDRLANARGAGQAATAGGVALDLAAEPTRS